MIVSRTPFRVTLGGGGTDLPSYYRKHGGMVFGLGIDKYVYVSAKASSADRKIRVKHTQSEVVDHPDQLRHDLAREALKRRRIYSRVEIASIADLRGGTGLGSSSSYLVGLLAALRSHKRESCSARELAEEACDLEIGVLERGVGKQDQYMAAFGGATVLDIARDGQVAVRRAKVNRATISDFVANAQLYWTGVQRRASDVLRDQDSAMKAPGAKNHALVADSLHAIKEIGHRVLAAIESENYDEFGRLMDEHWRHKKRLSARVSLPGIDGIYREIKKRFSVLGAKVSGAGGGGFLLVYAPKCHSELEAYMAKVGMRRMHYRVEFDGAKIIGRHPLSDRVTDQPV